MRHKKIGILSLRGDVNFQERDENMFRELGYEVKLASPLPPAGVYSKPSNILNPLNPLYLYDLCKKLIDTDVLFSWWAYSIGTVILSKIARKPCIIVAGGSEIGTSRDISKEYYSNRIVYAMVKLAIKLTLKFADKVISVSNYTKESADKICKNPTNETVYNSIDTKTFKPINVEKKPYIITVGWISKKNFKIKGILELLEAFGRVVKNHPEYRLIYVGDECGSFGEKAIIKERAEELGISNKVICMDFFKTAEEYTSFLNQCKIYVQYSWYEAFGVAMCEAMACGVPVIASNRAALPEVVGDAGLIVDRNNTNDLSEKIELLIRNKKLYDALSKKGAERVRNNFSKEIRKQKLKRIIEELTT